VETWKGLEEVGITLLCKFMNKILVKKIILDNRRDSILIPIFKDKDDVQVCENYHGTKLMSHTLKVLERILDGCLRVQVTIGR
jgi:hypothetical protein